MRLLVVGDTLLDRDVLGRVERVAPDAPVPVVDVTEVRERPGGAGLAALMAARPGVEVLLATAIGTDAAGNRVRELLAGRVEVHDVLAARVTPGKTRVRVAGQSLVRLDDAGHLLGSSSPSPVAVDGSGVLRGLVERCDAVLVADYGGPVSADPGLRSVLEQAAAVVPVVWDPHPRGLGPVAGCVAVTPNRTEARVMSGTDAAPGPTAELLRERWRAAAVTVTVGGDGVVTAAAEGTFGTPARPCPEDVDTCGAGDRYAGALALALAAGAPLPEAVDQAVRDVGAWLRAGGVGARRLDPGWLDELPDADAVLADVRAAGGTVVATGGCFDVLHAGHLSLLRAARGMGDALVVLLNSDDSVRRLKGTGRPVHTAADRARLLEALSCVDAVVVFEDDDPVATLERLRPDVWVKGGDYAAADLPEAAVVEAAGGRVVLVPHVGGHSTTRILAQGAS